MAKEKEARGTKTMAKAKARGAGHAAKKVTFGSNAINHQEEKERPRKEKGKGKGEEGKGWGAWQPQWKKEAVRGICNREVTEERPRDDANAEANAVTGGWGGETESVIGGF